MTGNALRRIHRRQRAASGNLDLRPYKIDPGDHLGHRMLNLQPGIHLQKEEAAIRPEDELDRACIAIARRLGDPHRCRTNLRAEGRRQVWRLRLLDDLLEAALHRAFALMEMNDPPWPSPSTWTSIWRGAST